MSSMASKTSRPRQHLFFKRMQVVIVMFIALTLLLYLVQKSVRYDMQESGLALLDPEALNAVETVEQEPTCLLLWQDDLQGRTGRALMEDVLSQIKVPYMSQKAGPIERADLEPYGSVVMAVTSLNVFETTAMDLLEWVRDGGKLMLTYMPDYSGYLSSICRYFGVVSTNGNYETVEELGFPRPFLLGTDSMAFPIRDAYPSSMKVLLEDESELYLTSGGETPCPLVWRYGLGSGTVVVMNLGYMDRIFRGFYAAGYSLLGDGFAWPVINGSTFYIDDFPSPVPGGDSKYITRDYGMTIKDFLTQIWWPDVVRMGEKHDVRYTGLVIETYSDQTEGPFPANEDLGRYNYFGRDLLDMGGEIGFHGYNHMPLVLSNFDYRGEYDGYSPWASRADMEAAMTELTRFCRNVFPNLKFQVYVPPSNILSKEGRAMIAEKFPEIRAIASVYLPDGIGYDQEFEVADDGIVEMPRIISGYDMNDYIYFSAMAELNYRYVNTHFQHPDDVLDVERGADLGWEELGGRMESYMDWLYASAPSIRNLTGTELAAAVQRYDKLQVDQTVEGDTMTLDLHGFIDEAWLMVRLSGREPGQVQGGELEKLLDGLYLLKAEESHVEIGLS